MAKRRDTDLNKWSDEWFSKPLLDQTHMLLWLYICDKCDLAGCWKVNLREAAFYIKSSTELEAEKTLAIFNTNELGMTDPVPRVIPIHEGKKWWIRSFAYFHYANKGTGKLVLNERHMFQGRVIQDIRVNGLEELFLRYYPGSIVNREMNSKRTIPIPTVQDIMLLPEAKDLSEVQIKSFWGYWQSRGWKRAGVPIADFSGLLTEWLANATIHTQQSSDKSFATVADINNEIHNLERQKFELRKDTEIKPGFTTPSITEEARLKIKQINTVIEGLVKKRQEMLK